MFIGFSFVLTCPHCAADNRVRIEEVPVHGNVEAKGVECYQCKQKQTFPAKQGDGDGWYLKGQPA